VCQIIPLRLQMLSQFGSGFPLDQLHDLGGFDGEIDSKVLGCMELLPVALIAKADRHIGQNLQCHIGLAHTSPHSMPMPPCLARLMALTITWYTSRGRAFVCHWPIGTWSSNGMISIDPTPSRRSRVVVTRRRRAT